MELVAWSLYGIADRPETALFIGADNANAVCLVAKGKREENARASY